MRNNKGVTLVALVITIIVLLILAGVSLAMLTGDSGILTNADEAKKQTEIANAKETIQMVYMDIKTDVYAKAVTADPDDDFNPNEDIEEIAERYVKTVEDVVTVSYTQYVAASGNTAAVPGVLTIAYENGVEGTITYNPDAETTVTVEITEE